MPSIQEAFADQYNYDLAVPTTWDQFSDIAEYFNGKDLNGDGEPDSGVVLAPQGRPAGHVPLHVLLGAVRDRSENPKLYWFNPDDMALLNSAATSPP